MLDSVGAKVWSIGAAFLTVSGFISGFALSNGLNQQEHKLINREIVALQLAFKEKKEIDRKKFDKINDKLNTLLIQKEINTLKAAYIEEF